MTVLEQSSFGSSPSKKIGWQSTNLTATATICERRHHTLLPPNSNKYFWNYKTALPHGLASRATAGHLDDPLTLYKCARRHCTV